MKMLFPAILLLALVLLLAVPACRRSGSGRALLSGLLLLAALPGLPARAATIAIGDFAAPPSAGAGIPAPWRVERFDPGVAATKYRLRVWDGVSAVEATASQAMAVLVRPLAVDLAVTPFLCWRWRVEATVAAADILTKAGDDYAARLYLMFRVAPRHLSFGVRTSLALARAVRGDQVPDAALNYVWDNRSAIGTVLPNAYTGRAMMWVLESGDAAAGRWVVERRDVLADFRQAFGHPPENLYALALATDTDNTGGTATAGFADLRFVSVDQPCY